LGGRPNIIVELTLVTDEEPKDLCRMKGKADWGMEVKNEGAANILHYLSRTSQRTPATLSDLDWGEGTKKIDTRDIARYLFMTDEGRKMSIATISRGKKSRNRNYLRYTNPKTKCQGRDSKWPAQATSTVFGMRQGWGAVSSHR